MLNFLEILYSLLLYFVFNLYHFQTTGSKITDHVKENSDDILVSTECRVRVNKGRNEDISPVLSARYRTLLNVYYR